MRAIETTRASSCGDDTRPLDCSGGGGDNDEVERGKGRMYMSYETWEAVRPCIMQDESSRKCEAAGQTTSKSDPSAEAADLFPL